MCERATRTELRPNLGEPGHHKRIGHVGRKHGAQLAAALGHNEPEHRDQFVGQRQRVNGKNEPRRRQFGYVDVLEEVSVCASTHGRQREASVLLQSAIAHKAKKAQNEKTNSSSIRQWIEHLQGCVE